MLRENMKDHHDYSTTSAAMQHGGGGSQQQEQQPRTDWRTRTKTTKLRFTTLSHHGIDHQFRRSSSKVECHGHSRET